MELHVYEKRVRAYMCVCVRVCVCVGSRLCLYVREIV